MGGRGCCRVPTRSPARKLLSLARVGGGDVADSPPVSRHRVGGAGDAPESGAEGPRRPAATVERLVEVALSPPPAGRRRWITRLLAQEVGSHRRGVRRAAPQRAQAAVGAHLKVRRDPDFVAKVRDSVGLYLDPPEPPQSPIPPERSFRKARHGRMPALGRSVNLDEKRRLWSDRGSCQLRTIDAVHRGHLVHIGRQYIQWALPPSAHYNVVDVVIGFAT
jgi:hypothetical protein